MAESRLLPLPGKRALIKRTFRPPNYETPVSDLGESFTPNDAFFVRYHLMDIPEVDAAQWRLRIGGDSLSTPLELSLDDLGTGFEQVEIAAVCQCAGNRRGWSIPHVPGVEWGPGAMGNAKWTGVRLRDVLNKAGIKAGAIEVVFDGADKGVIEKTPDFIKSLPMDKALDDNTLIAHRMNGEALPHWNGFPARLVVPGWAATYWVKHLTSIDVASTPFTGFWMAKAYRIPKGKFPLIDRFVSQEGEANTPITELVVNSLITNLSDGQKVAHGKPTDVRGIAWDGGRGVDRVEVSIDGGQHWQAASLGEDQGRFSWRTWSYPVRPEKRGNMTVMARASNRAGSSQTFELIWNPAGYHNNVVQRHALTVV
ncbi:MAG: molybdopterin-dependent oxidoreductase [Rhodospirillales bacterium]|nr:molybdopterin-dependent oxidoreductase [Rhodospirillales bacterium]